MRKLLASVALVLVLCGLVQLLFGTHPEEGTGLMEYYRLSSEKGTGGGLIGGLICMALTAVLGNIGAFLVLIVCLAISVVCITERSLVKAVKRQSGAAYRYAREDMEAFLGTKVYLNLWVKVKEKWRDNEMSLNNFGYNKRELD